MARTLTIYQGEDQTPATDITDMVEWPDCEFGQRAYLGEGTLSAVRFRDVDGRTGNSANLPAGLTSLSLAAHNVVRWTEGSNTMFRGRVSPKDYSRGAQVAGRAREAQITLDDYNKDLHNIVVHDYSRPAETDKARVQGILASYLSGNPRVTTNLNGSNFVSSSNTVSLPAITYTRTNVLEVLTSIATAANKQFFVTIDSELFYDGNDSTLYASPLKISDRDTEVNNVNVFAPIWDVGPASTEDGQQLLSGVWLFYGESQYVHVTNPTVANQYSWWEDIVYDDTVTTATQATVVANAILARRQHEERTYNVSIGPLARAQWGSLKHGQLIQIKARAIPDADDAYVSRRITELRWTPLSDPESLMAHMTLDRPIKVNPYGPGQKADTIIPKPAPACVDDTGIGSAVALTGALCSTPEYASGNCTISSGVFPLGPFCDYPSAGATTAYTTLAVGHYWSQVDLGIHYNAVAPGTFKVEINDSTGTLPTITTVLFTGILPRCDYDTVGGTFEVPTGYNRVRFKLGTRSTGYLVSSGSHRLYNYTPASSLNDEFCLPNGGGESPHFARSDDPRFDQLAAAIDAIDAGGDHSQQTNLSADTHPQYRLTTDGGRDVVKTVIATGSTETLDLAEANYFDLTLTANCTLTFTAPAPGVACAMSLLLRQDGTGSRTVTWPASVDWIGGVAPTLQTGANTWDRVELETTDGGVNWRAQHVTSSAVSLDGLSDVTITAAALGDMLRYDGSAWVDTSGYWATIVAGSAPPVAVTNEAADDWLVGWVPA